MKHQLQRLLGNARKGIGLLALGIEIAASVLDSFLPEPPTKPKPRKLKARNHDSRATRKSQ